MQRVLWNSWKLSGRRRYPCTAGYLSTRAHRLLDGGYGSGRIEKPDGVIRANRNIIRNMSVGASPTSPRSPVATAFPPFRSPTSPTDQDNHGHRLPRTVEERDQGPHAYRPPNGACRSPCPCLNALANHSYLPHDGRNITFSDIVSSLQKGLGLSPGFALFMAVGTFTLLRRPSLAPFDLHGASRHNFIEHNASMVHQDTRPEAEYAPTKVDLTLLHEFLAKAHTTESSGEQEVITQDDISARRIEREAECGPVDALHAELGRAEFAMVMEIFGKGKDKELVRADLEVFLKEERLPDGWTPTHTVHLWEALSRSSKLRNAMKRLREAGPQEHDEAEGEGVVGWFKMTVEKLERLVHQNSSS